MSEQSEKQKAQKQPEHMETYGQQGNQGQYGQGQYDSEGKPDPRGKQAQQIKPDPSLHKQEKTDAAARRTEQQQRGTDQP